MSDAPLAEATTASESGSVYLPRLARIKSVETLTDTEKAFHLEEESGKALGHHPGQFVAVSVPGVGEAPISVCTSPTEGPGFGVCVRRVGTLTTHMHNMVEGVWLGLRGPFGQGFPMEESRGMDLLYVAGGIGLAPLRSAIRYSLDCRNEYGDITILYGTRSPGELLFADELKQWAEREDVNVMTTVDAAADGWDGHVGVLTTLFPKLGRLAAERTVAMVVGPPVMYRFVLLELLGKDIPHKQIVFSLERRMKCGVGKCGHCQINGTYVCQEGPVFRYPRLEQLWEAVERVAPVG